MLHKKILCVSFCFLFAFQLFNFSCKAGFAPGDVSAESAVLMLAQSGEVIFEKNSREIRSMASTTKIMTAILAVESGRLEQTVEITDEMCNLEGTSIGLKPGYKLKLIDLVYAMMLESGNDAANAVACFLAGNVESFCALMNKKAKELSMTQTNFETASGLDSKNHYSTAYDMALLGAYAIENPLLLQIVGSKSVKIDYIKPDITVTFSNHNRLLRLYDGAIGIKTGFTKKSGRCLVSAAKKDGATLIAVTLSAPDDWNDHKKLLDFGFSSLKSENVFLRTPDTVSVVGGKKKTIKIRPEQYPVTVSFYDKQKITQRVYLPKFVYAPIKDGDKLGSVELYTNGKLLGKINIVASQSCLANEASYVKRKSIFSKIKERFNFFNK